jgi:AP-2 complex subunit mu-1
MENQAGGTKWPGMARNAPVALSALYFLNLRGDVILERQYRDDVDRNMANAFKTEIINGKDRGGNPVVNLGMCSFMYTREQNVYVVAVTLANANAMLAFTFMHSLINLFKSYFNKFNEKTLKSNFVIIYELLDEVCDNGYPQITSPEVLKAFITQRAARAADDPKDTYENQRKAKEVSMQVTGAVQWRGQNLVYKKNEVYLDIVESVSLLMSPKGVVLKASATGTIEMKTALSGMPELTIGLNDKVGEEASANQTQQSAQSNHKKNIDLADLQFHQCVNLSKFASEKTISFVPPDGKFDLMKYRVTEGISLPFKLMPLVKGEFLLFSDNLHKLNLFFF